MRSVALIVCLAVLAIAANAQISGSITGTITDPAGAAVATAKIEVRSQDTGAIYEGGTSATGNYVIAVPPGNFQITVTVSGFKKYVQQNIQVPTQQTVRLDVTLQVGNVTDSVTVTESAPLLKTESGEISHTVTVDQADNLPVLTIGTGTGFGAIRNPMQVANLLPGVQFSADNILRVNGMPSNSEAIRIEGQDATNGIWRQAASINQAGMEAVQEVSVQTSNFAAEYGQAAGGYFNFTMKSGTNQFHGSGYEYYVNEFLNAGTPYTDAGVSNSLKRGQHVVNKQRRSDYGFTIGGPIRIPRVYNGQNKSFFFFNFEQFRETQGISNGVTTVPTVAYQNGNFATTTPVCTATSAGCPGGPGSPTYLTQSGVLAHDALGRVIPQYGVYDPKTTRAAPDGTVVRDLFPNGQITPDRFDPVALAIQKLMPQPNNSNLINNYNIPFYTNFKHTTNPSVKLDQSLSPTIKISGYYSLQLTTSPGNNGLDPVLTAVTPTNNRSHTIRINYDQTVRPTVLLHLGIGYLHTYNPTFPSPFDQSKIGLHGFYSNLFPNVTGLSNITTGGASLTVGPGTFSSQEQWDEKPTANANLTWVKNNHNFKFGAEMVIDGVIINELARGNGIFGISANSTSDPWQNTPTGGVALNSTSGFPYASFLLGQVDNLTTAPAARMKLGNHGISFYAQDSWKVTRKLTLDYGLRYDFQTYLREQYGRMQDASFTILNTKVNRLGGVIYEGHGPGQCNCDFSHNYPYAFGPRLGLAYQIDSKTVFRAGSALTYGTTSNNSQLSLSIEDFYVFNAPGFGNAAATLAAGNPYAAGNPFGNPTLTWPNFDASKYPTRTVCPGTANATCYAPQTPFINIDPSSRPPRILQWSFGLQREVTKNLVVEASYVGNRGVWFTAPGLTTVNQNAFNGFNGDLAQFGLNINNPADRTLLTTQISSPLAIQRGFKLAYVGMPSTTTVLQNIRPYPQWAGGVPPFLGPPLGKTWYDSLQAKVTKRYSHGLDMQGSFTWGKELSLGSNSDTAYLTAGPTAVNDVFNRDQNKEISPLSRPMLLIISGTYLTPKIRGDGRSKKVLSQVTRDWQIGAVLRYQSGALIEVPPSNNGLFGQLGRSGGGFFSGGTTYWNFANGNQNLFLKDPNCHCFDPTKDLVLNPAAWTDTPAGQFSVNAPYYNNYRWQRQPSENMNFARNFKMGPEGRYQLQIRGEFQNIFNRHFYSAPSTGGIFNTNPASATTNTNAFYQGGPAAGALSGGFGYVSYLNGAGASPRTGLLVARFTF